MTGSYIISSLPSYVELYHVYTQLRYRPNLPVSYVSEVLGFSNLEDCLAFLVSLDVVLVNNSSMDCKLTQTKLNS